MQNLLQTIDYIKLSIGYKNKKKKFFFNQLINILFKKDKCKDGY